MGKLAVGGGCKQEAFGSTLSSGRNGLQREDISDPKSSTHKLQKLV